MGVTSLFWFLVYLLNAQSRFPFFFDELADKKRSKNSSDMCLAFTQVKQWISSHSWTISMSNQAKNQGWCMYAGLILAIQWQTAASCVFVLELDFELSALLMQLVTFLAQCLGCATLLLLCAATIVKLFGKRLYFEK